MRTLLLSVVFYLILLPGKVSAFQMAEEIVYDDAMLIQVIKDVQVKTSFYFLYRESQIADINVSLVTNDNDVLNDLANYLSGFGLTMQIDRLRNQVLLVKSSENIQQSRSIFISGQVVDATSGERLPYATISWINNQKLNGTVTNGSGVFSVQRKFQEQYITLNVSYIGYQHASIKIDVSNHQSINDLTVRLIPTTLKGNEIIITDYMGYNPMDTLITGMIDAGRFSPLGESNSIRALQSHPSVSNGPALNQGIHVRGSSPDGFTVLLDGMSIFNQTHLFGLLDSFNDNAIQSAGYFFDITPAHIESATGGTLNLITRTGSRNQFKKQIGISNSSINATLEGPLGSRTSWLFSGRASYIDRIAWFDNPSLIQWGLDVDRPKEIVTNEPDFTELVLKPGKSNASFVDIHSKIYVETKNSDRLTLSTYFGGDDASHVAERRTRSASTQGEFVFLPVSTSNKWGNALVSLAYDRVISSQIFSKTIVGFSTYRTDFSKEDFVYSRISEINGNESVTIFTYPFRNRSSMTELKINQELSYNSQIWSLISGATLKHYTGAYSEYSFDRPSYYTRFSSYLADFYTQADFNPFYWIHIQAGMRAYRYSLNRTIDFAPRIKTRFKLIPEIHLIGGYSVNQQYLHKISIENATTADVWVLTSKDQPSAKSSQISMGIELSPSRNMYVKFELYDKKYEHIRVHELNQQSFENSFSDVPWMYGNSGHAKGLEILLRNIWDRFTLTQSYTLSKMIYRNPFLFNGESFFADWDRTHSYNPVLEIDVNPNFKLNLSWLMMTGIPNSIEITKQETQSRLDEYQRLDFSGTWDNKLSGTVNLQFKFSIYNLLNRKNVWYRNFAFNFDETRSIPLLRPVSVDVLDLGLQPSFSVKLSF